MNYAIVQGGVVVNTIVWDGQSAWDEPQGSVVVQIPDGAYVGIGSAYDGKTFGAPPAPPETVV